MASEAETDQLAISAKSSPRASRKWNVEVAKLPEENLVLREVRIVHLQLFLLRLIETLHTLLKSSQAGLQTAPASPKGVEIISVRPDRDPVNPNLKPDPDPTYK